MKALFTLVFILFFSLGAAAQCAPRVREKSFFASLFTKSPLRLDMKHTRRWHSKHQQKTTNARRKRMGKGYHNN